MCCKKYFKKMSAIFMIVAMFGSAVDSVSAETTNKNDAHEALVTRSLNTDAKPSTTHYSDENGVVIAPSVTGDSFAPYKDIVGYESLGSKIAGYTKTYLYKKIRTPKPSTTHYIDEDGKAVAPSVTGDSFAPYKNIAGYELLGSKIAGYTRTYLYKKIRTPKPLTTHYVDENGKAVAPSVTGDSFAPYKDIAGYESLSSKIIGYTRTYLYAKKTVKKPVQNKGQEQSETGNKKYMLPETGSTQQLHVLGLILILFAYGIYREKQK